jgi:putative transposase
LASCLPWNNANTIHGVYLVDGLPTIVFLTVCSEHRRSWLATDEVHQKLCRVWEKATAWLVGRYVILPDHIHLFAGLSSQMQVPFDNWVRYWKSQFTKQHRRPADSWQTDHWDTRMRSQAQYCEKLEYAIANPVRRGLVSSVEEWPHQGVIYDLSW